ncbi:MAG: radical SAM protein [Muribaculaceae bacterium]|nr:radical SAM protein [Muribaculaceae bacterium]
MKYKASDYNICQNISKDIYLCSNFFRSAHILLSEKKYKLFTNATDPTSLLSVDPKLVNDLVKGGFIIPDEMNELEIYLNNQKKAQIDNSYLHIVVNPTLDCNLNCWYCYENKVPHSTISQEVLEGIKKYISDQYQEISFNTLKITFFGGEPFLKPQAITDLVEFSEQFCKHNNLRLLLDFTTNGTLITDRILNLLSNKSCVFQITLDGDRERHNKIKYSIHKQFDTYSKVIKTLHDIQHFIPDSKIYVRINFDNETLKGFKSIFESLLTLDKSKCCIIIKKVWQVNSDEIAKEDILNVLSLLFQAGFEVDFYSQGGLCFADRNNQVTINFDGNVFKCTTIPKFADEYILGKLDCKTGKISWLQDRVDYLQNDSINPRCQKCRMLPSCGGPCRKKTETLKSDFCFLDSICMTEEEFALTQFQIELAKTTQPSNNIIVK